MTPQGSVSYRPNYVGVPLQGFRRDNKAETAGAIASVRARLDALRRTHTAGDASTRHVNWSRSRNMFVEPRVHSLADFSGGGSSPKRGETIRSSPQFMKALPAKPVPPPAAFNRPNNRALSFSNNGPDMRARPATSGGFCTKTMYKTSNAHSDGWIRASYNGTGLPPNRTMTPSRVPVRSGFTRALKMDHDANPILKNNGFTLTDTQMMYRDNSLVMTRNRAATQVRTQEPVWGWWTAGT